MSNCCPCSSSLQIITAVICLQMVLSVVYAVSPIDIIPEGNIYTHTDIYIFSPDTCLYFLLVYWFPYEFVFCPFWPEFLCAALLGLFGLMDDIFILLICFLYIAAIYRSVLYNRHGET